MTRRTAFAAKFLHLPRSRAQPERHGGHRLRPLRLSPPLVKLLARLRLREKDEYTPQSSPSLLDLPVEVLEEIFLLACVDGGRTACSLALVSKWVNATSRVARFHSISLFHDGCGCKVRQLLSSYDDACRQAEEEKAIRPRIRNLAVFTDPLLESDYMNWYGDLGKNLRQHMSRQKHTYCPAKAAWSHKLGERMFLSKKEREEAAAAALLKLVQSYLDSVQKLLAKVANDVETLVLRRHQVRDKLPVLRVRSDGFPELRELWLLRETYVEFTLVDARPGDPLFPGLRRLHAINPDYDANFARYVHDAPALETFYVRGHTLYLFPPPWIKSIATVAANQPQWPRLRPIHILIQAPLWWPTRPSGDSIFWERQSSGHYENTKTVYDELCNAGTRIVFVPYCTESLGLIAGAASHWMTDEVIATRDWLARVSQSSATDSEFDGIYIRDFWKRYEGEGRRDDQMLQLIKSGQLGADIPYVPPLVRYNPTPQPRGRRRVQNGNNS